MKPKWMATYNHQAHCVNVETNKEEDQMWSDSHLYIKQIKW